MIRKRNWLQGFLFIFLLALGLEVIVIAPQSLNQPPGKADLEDRASDASEVSSSDVNKPVQQSMSGVHLVESGVGGKEWELWSQKAYTYKGSSSWSLEKVKTKFFGKSGLTFDVTGDRGVADTQTKNMKIRGNVVAKSSNGYVFKTQSVEYDSKSRILSGPDSLVLEGPELTGLIVHGRNFEANLDSSLMEVKEDVRAEKFFKNSKRVFIRSQRMQFSGTSYFVRFLEKVIVDYETMRLTGPDVSFDLDRKSNQMNSMKVRGGAKVTDIDKWATSDQIDVDFLKETFVFNGAPRVVQDKDELRGDQIIFFDGGKRIKVKNTKAQMDKKAVKLQR